MKELSVICALYIVRTASYTLTVAGWTQGEGAECHVLCTLLELLYYTKLLLVGRKVKELSVVPRISLVCG